jgi:rhodanese-related sulfurtransferase
VKRPISTLTLTLAVAIAGTSALTAVTFAQSPAATPTPAVKQLSRVELDALLAQPDRTVILDVRRPDELQSIGGFPAYLSIQSADLPKHLAAIPRDRQIVTVSNHASRATRAADLLLKNGFDVAGAIGAQDYEADGGTLVKVAPPAARATAAGEK